MIRVLVLEDEPLIQMDTAMSLEAEGHRVTTSETVEGVEAIIAVEEIAVAVLDLNLGLGRRDGIEAAKMIQRVRPLAKIIFLTAYNDEVSVARMKAVNPFLILNKPLSNAARTGMLDTLATFEGVA